MLELALIALLILVYSIFAEKIEKVSISGPMIFLVIGIALGPIGLKMISFSVGNEGYKLLSEVALALVLFTDASKANLKVLKSNYKIPARLLLIGLPLCIIAGILTGKVIFTEFSWIELAILATVLAPTDAALGEPVVNNKAVPSKIRTTLNVESGLNDGIVVPILFLLMAIYSIQNGEVTTAQGIMLFLEELGIGAAVGLGVTFIVVKLIILSLGKHWLEESWKPMLMITLSVGCFALAQGIHGSGFIACYVGGLLFGKMLDSEKIQFQKAADGTGKLLSLLVWIIFGAVVISEYYMFFSWEIVVYSILSLTLIRMIPMLLSLYKSGVTLYEAMFVSWFGPRGLASIVFIIIVMGINIENNDTFALTAICTVFLSVFAHGFTASPMANAFKRKQTEIKTE
jgi:NhaP-type Na+/H+ or K+/H+ antiporter